MVKHYLVIFFKLNTIALSVLYFVVEWIIFYRRSKCAKD